MKTHYTHNYLLNPYHKVTVNLIGAGGTGSQMLHSLARIDYALYKLGHPGLQVTVFDDDIVTEANIGRQLFCLPDLGLNKAQVLTSRINSFFGISWDCEQSRFPNTDCPNANITISCVDNVKSRIEIGKHLRNKDLRHSDESKALYWLDFGNQTDRGQVILGTIEKIEQPKSKQQTVKYLKSVDEYFDLSKVEDKESGPSCSLAEALSKQDLFINSALCQVGSALLWKLITEGAITMQGAYLNLSTLNVNPINL